MIFTCRQVSNVVADEHLKKMSKMRRMLVCFHLSWCPICKRYNKHVMQMQDAADALIRLEENEPTSEKTPHMGEECRCRIQSLLSELMEASEQKSSGKTDKS